MKRWTSSAVKVTERGPSCKPSVIVTPPGPASESGEGSTSTLTPRLDDVVRVTVTEFLLWSEEPLSEAGSLPGDLTRSDDTFSRKWSFRAPRTGHAAIFAGCLCVACICVGVKAVRRSRGHRRPVESLIIAGSRQSALQRRCNPAWRTKTTVARHRGITRRMTSSNLNQATDPSIRRPDGEGPLHARVVARLGLRLGFRRSGDPRRAQPGTTEGPCGHTRHVGTCPTCQRVQLARWREQLAHHDDAASIGAKEGPG